MAIMRLRPIDVRVSERHELPKEIGVIPGVELLDRLERLERCAKALGYNLEAEYGFQLAADESQNR
jgi:hypothetical protein